MARGRQDRRGAGAPRTRLPGGGGACTGVWRVSGLVVDLDGVGRDSRTHSRWEGRLVSRSQLRSEGGWGQTLRPSQRLCEENSGILVGFLMCLSKNRTGARGPHGCLDPMPPLLGHLLDFSFQGRSQLRSLTTARRGCLDTLRTLLKFQGPEFPAELSPPGVQVRATMASSCFLLPGRAEGPGKPWERARGGQPPAGADRVCRGISRMNQERRTMLPSEHAQV